MMQLCKELSLFIFLVLFLYYSNLFPATTTNTKLNKSIFWALFLFIIYTNYFSVESFHFEVTPWKRTCLNDHPNRCNGCCLPGFNGQAINFHYTGDAERMNMAAAGCTECKGPLLKNHAYDYSALGNTYGPIEGYHGKDYKYSALGNTYGHTEGYHKGGYQSLGKGYDANTTFPMMENYCGGSHDMIESYEDCS